MAALGRFALLALAVAGCACGSSPTAPRVPVCTPLQSLRPFDLNPGETFRVDFAAVAPMTADVLFSWVGERVHGWTTGGTAVQKLFDGDRLLGSSTIDSFVVIWSAPDSPINRPSSPAVSQQTTIVDFTTIQDGSIRGRLEFAVASGTFAIVPTDESQFAAASGLNLSDLDWTAIKTVAREVCR